MKIEISKEDLISLVKGRPPYYSEFENPLVKKAGHRYSEGHGGSFDNLKSLTEEELYELYLICKNSW